MYPSLYRISLVCMLLMTLTIHACVQSQSNPVLPAASHQEDTSPWFINSDGDTIYRVVVDERTWKEELDPMQYYVLREKGTERAFTGIYHDSKKPGTYSCSGCGLVLFKSDTKFDSGCGWPSFFEPIDSTHVTYTPDNTHGMMRTEVTCSRCGGHLGHVFDDGPRPTGLRFCMNSASLEFKSE